MTRCNICLKAPATWKRHYGDLPDSLLLCATCKEQYPLAHGDAQEQITVEPVMRCTICGKLSPKLACKSTPVPGDVPVNDLACPDCL